jgi:DNA-binding XRE family transcriptional regulator
MEATPAIPHFWLYRSRLFDSKRFRGQCFGCRRLSGREKSNHLVAGSGQNTGIRAARFLSTKTRMSTNNFMKEFKNMTVLSPEMLWKLRRVAADLRQQDVAQTVGISTSRYSAIERGEEVATEMDRILIENALPPLPMVAAGKDEIASLNPSSD